MNLHELFDKCLNKNLIDLTISGRKDKLQDEVSKVKIRPVIIKNNLLFQVSEYKGTKVYHDNYSEADVRNYIEKMMTDNFKQAQFKMTDADAQVLSGKNSNMTIKYKKSCEVRCQKELSHNRNKKYILEEGKKVDFLVDLGVMTKEGKIVNQRYDKYRQINRFLEFIDMEHTPKNLLIRAVYTGKKNGEAAEKLKKMESELNLDLTLNKLL